MVDCSIPPGDAKRGKKNYMHALRTLDYALQILRDGAITDLQAPNHYWPEVRTLARAHHSCRVFALNYTRTPTHHRTAQISSGPSTRWEDYKRKYGPLFRELKDQVIALTEPLPLPTDLRTPYGEGPRLATFTYIAAHGLRALSRVFKPRPTPSVDMSADFRLTGATRN